MIREDSVIQEPSKWSLIQFAFLCCYTVGMHGSISLPFYISVYAPYFLLAYYALMIVVCVPVCYVQIRLGAVYRHGIVGIFSQLLPILKGVGVAILALTYIRCLTNGLELSYSLCYAVVAFASPYSSVSRSDDETRFPFHFGDTFLQRSEGITNSGSMVWYIVLSLVTTWFIIYVFTFRGLPFIGKISYIVSPVAIILTVVAFGYGYSTELPEVPYLPRFKHYRVVNATSVVGNMTYLLEHDIKSNSMNDYSSASMLLSPKPWIDALILHLHGIGLWSGVLPLLGTQLYNKSTTINAAWSILLVLYGLLPILVVFAFLPYYDMQTHEGFLASLQGIKPGISFILIGLFGKARFVPGIAMCVYLSIFLFGILHQALHFLTVLDALLPSIPTFIMRFLHRKEMVTALTCVFSFLLSLPFASQGGVYLYTIVNSFVDRLIFTLIIVSMVPFLLGYIKQEYLHLPIERAFMCIWYGLASVFPAALLIYYFSVYVYPYFVLSADDEWTETLGWLIAVAPIVMCVVLGAIHALVTQKGSLKQKFIQTLKTDHLRTTDSTTDYDFSDTANTGVQTSKSPSLTNIQNNQSKVDTEVVIQPPDQAPVEKV